jgi:hypothetical protein
MRPHHAAPLGLENQGGVLAINMPLRRSLALAALTTFLLSSSSSSVTKRLEEVGNGSPEKRPNKPGFHPGR